LFTFFFFFFLTFFCFCASRRIAVAHVGDTRAVLVHRNQTHALTSSHTPYRVDECVRVKAGGGSISWVGVPRVNGKLAVTRAFCALSMRGAGIIATPEIKFITLNPDETAGAFFDQWPSLFFIC
jgi:serine/threonine protein phosphatase PrpC